MAKAKEKRAAAPKGSLASFQEKHGAMRVDPAVEVLRGEKWPTGSLVLDRLLRGGISKGRIAEIYGPPGGGKTTLAMKIIGLALGVGIPCAYFDLEHTLEVTPEDLADEDKTLTPDQRSERKESWLQINGVNPTDENFHWYKSDSGEQLFTMLADVVRDNLFGIVVVDSIPQIVTKRMNDSEVGDAMFGARAKLLAEELPRLMRLYNKNPRTTIIFINQVRENIGAQIKSQKATGGYALDHDVRIKIKIQRTIRKVSGDDVVSDTRVKVEKNVSGPSGEGMIRISAKRGIDTLWELLDYAVEFGYVHTSGNWHYIFAEPIEAPAFKAAWAKKKHTELPGYLTGQNGENGALDWLAANGWQSKLYALATKASA
jgi:recombination protein RecA